MANTASERIINFIKILHEQTDASHTLTLPQIQERLDEMGTPAERKTLYRYFDTLEAEGIHVAKAPTRPVSYYLESRLFEPAQMMMLVDAVQTAHPITKANSAALIRKLKRLVSMPQARELDARIHVPGRVKMQNESIFCILDIIQRAIAERRDISFDYFRYDCNLCLHDAAPDDGLKRIKTPLFLVYSDGNYYLLVWDEKTANNIRSYRVDRIQGVMILEKSPRNHKAPSDFDIATYKQESIGMYSGKPQRLKLLVAEPLVGAIVDIFGADNLESRQATKKDSAPDDGRPWALMHAYAAATPVLFGKLAQFGPDVRLAGPKRAIEAYRAHLETVLANLA